MPRADRLLFGYFVITVEPSEICRASDIFLKTNISSTFKSDGRFIISFRDRKKAEEALKGKIEYRISAPKGLKGFFINNRNKIGAALGVLLIAFLSVFSSDVVWDVRIEGAEPGTEQKILEELSRSGLEVGGRWSKIDTSLVEMQLLSNSEQVSWANINRRGSVAYVKVSDKIVNHPEKVPEGYANIVATRDCVIEEIIVKNGYAMVKKGESVRAGEILISGVFPSEIGGGFCYAEGEVIGRYSDEISVSVKRTKEEKRYTGCELISTDVKIFNKNVNIFKNYRQSQKNCDIIKEAKELITRKRLPITLVKTYVKPYVFSEIEISDSEMISEATELLEEELRSYLSDKTVKRMKTSGDFSADEYVMICYMTVSSDIAKIQEFEVNVEK